MELALGKLPPEILKKYILRMTGVSSRELVVTPAIGIDFGVVRHNGGYLIVSSDPVTGVENRIGWYAVNVSANDVATSGSRPRFIQSIILLPENATEETLRTISSDMHSTCKKLGITIVGGHTELTPGLSRPIVITTAFTFSKKFVSASDARDGDSIMMTKTAGVEGTAILADRKVLGKSIGGAVVEGAKRFYEKLSVVREAEAAFRTGAVHALHDCTEGGVLGAVYEMGYASKLGFKIFESKIPVANATQKICSALSIDPLRLISSGTLLLSLRSDAEARVRKALASVGTPSVVIGKFSGRERILIHKDGSEEKILTSGMDEIWRIADHKQRISPAQMERSGIK